MKIIKILTLFAAFALIFGCDNGDDVTYNTSENSGSASVILSAASNALALKTGEAAEITLKAADEYGDPLTGAQVTFLDSEGFITFNHTSNVTDASGNLAFSVTADTNYFEEKTGEIIVRVTDGRSSGRALISYNIAPWSGELWSDGLEVSASLMRGIYGHTTEIAAPKGLEIESVSPSELSGGSVNVSVIKNGSALSFTAYNYATEGEGSLSVKIKGVRRAYQIPVRIALRDGSADKPFPINSPHELQSLSASSAFDPYNYILENDIDFTDTAWRSIDNFSGSVNGNGHSITGLRAPFAKRITSTGATFKNIRFVIPDGASPVGQFTVAVNQSFYGGIIAMEAMTLNLENVLIEGGYTFNDGTGTTYKYLGLAAGMIRKLNADNVTVRGYINANAAYTYTGLFAGSIGNDSNILSTARNITVEGTINAKPISATNATTNTLAGGLAGRVVGLNINGCAVRADITLNYAANYGGGIAGEFSYYNTVNRCYFAGNLVSDNTTASARHLGGIAGHVSGTGNMIMNSYSSGTLRLSGGALAASYVGGIIGNSTMRADIINCYSSAGIDSLTYAAGLSGSASTAANAVYIAYSAAVNSYIYGVTASARIGINPHENSAGNYTYADMPTAPGPIDEGSLKDGVSMSGIDAGSLEFFLNWAGFSLDIWDTDYSSRSYKLPILKGLGEEQKNFPNTNHYY
jgi:hypothetical protein